MPLPPQGDPNRPLQLAVRSSRALGVMFVALGGLSIVPMMLMSGGISPGVRVVVASAAVLYLLPGVFYLVVASFLERRAAWAVTTGIVVASFHGLFALIALAKFSRLLTGGGGFGGRAVLSATLLLLWLATTGQLVYHLWRSYGAVRLTGSAQRGFAPIGVRPAAAGADGGNAPPPPPLSTTEPMR